MQNYNDDKLEKRLNEITNEPDGQNLPRKSQADKLVKMVEESNCTLFHDQFKDTYAHVFIEDHWETWKIKSKQFKHWLCGLFWDMEQKAPNTNAINSALNILESQARFKGKQINLENRVALFEGAIWYDLSNEKCQAVKITPDGWEIVDNPPILFKRYAHQQAQVLPVKEGGDVKALLPFVNLAKMEQSLLLPIYLVSCFLPDIPHTIPLLYGPQGAAKTTLARMLCALIDPSSVSILSLPNQPNDLIQQLAHHWFAFFDNVTLLPDWASDAFCRAVTGEGFSKRELYSDDDDVIYQFRRCIGLNGINLAARKPDLLDRGILLKLDRISKEQRKSEKIIWENFGKVRPIILGGIFNALSRAMQICPSIQLNEVPRMADFTIWGCAIAEALGYSPDEFLKNYYSNIGEQHDEAIQENSVATAIMAFMENQEKWEGSPSKLFEELNAVAVHENLDVRGSGWPKSANILSRRINEVKTNLAEKNIFIESGKINNGRRLILIQKKSPNTATLATQIGEVQRLFGGEIIEEETESPQLSQPIFSLSKSQKNNSGASGDISPLSFTS